MPKQPEYLSNVAEYLQQLPLGAFLTVKAGDQSNTMTIGWGAIGYMWNKPVMIVMVRFSRFTHGLIDAASDFSVSVPTQGNYKKALAEVGTKSGRDMDKFACFNLEPVPGRMIESPVIGNCGLIYECRTLYKQPMQPELLMPEIADKFYKDHDYHVLYFGHILTQYNNLA